jgi:K+-sensing histidine kinase KdpD
MSARAELQFVEAKRSLLRRWISPITVSLVLFAATTALLVVLDKPVAHEHLIYIYFVPTALIAIRYGSVSAMCVIIGAAFAAAYFFYAPRFSLAVESPLDMLELIFFSLLALLASQVVSGFAKDGDVERRGPRARASMRWPWFAGLRGWLGR